MSLGKRRRVFSREFKLRAVERFMAGESASALSRELHLRRKLLYQWKDAYWVGGVAGLRTRGRPRKEQLIDPMPEAKTGRAELLQARRRIAELERKVGQQQLELDFFVEALRRVKTVEEDDPGNGPSCTRSLGNKHGKAD